jgi:GNAT superfamily N-acetyltransferase
MDGDLQRIGVGRKPISAFLDELHAHNVDEVRLITGRRQRAAAFYERLGWDRLIERPAADGTPVIEFRRRPIL